MRNFGAVKLKLGVIISQMAKALCSFHTALTLGRRWKGESDIKVQSYALLMYVLEAELQSFAEPLVRRALRWDCPSDDEAAEDRFFSHGAVAFSVRYLCGFHAV